MDINTLRGIATILAMTAFLGVVWWAYSDKRKKDFSEAANLPFADEQNNERDKTPDQ
ncbi:MAG: cbb3-type cytochrome c oxidase subunit 3 [Pseudomonadales bacterium]